MLSWIEKILFALAALASIVSALYTARRIVRIIRRGHGRPDWFTARKRLFGVLGRTISLQPTFRLRLGPSLLHAMVAWGFIDYLLVNLGEVLHAYLPGFLFLGTGWIGNIFRLGADVLSVGVLMSMVALLLRRFLLKPEHLNTRPEVLLYPRARSGIRRDSLVVGAFILLHVGSHFLGASIKIASTGEADAWQPLASALARLWTNWRPPAYEIAIHVAFWLAMGTILAFIPYFLYSKHIHLFFAPLNFLLKPERRSMGELGAIDFEDESQEQFGATRLEDLGWEQLMDAYACIMCYRCQEVCPAYATGKVLSPAALEINKRYFLNAEGAHLARGEVSEPTLVEFAILPEAVWACTACGACVDICPVGNEPMRDILDVRRSMVLMENQFPKQLQAAFRGMERSANPWGVSAADRLKWTEGLPETVRVPTIEENPEPEFLWWVGCASATDVRAQKIAQAFARLLNAAEVSFAVLGQAERCTGDSARRAGKEDIFYALATANVEILNEVKPKRIVTTCPHCLHTLKNEYPAYGGNYEVMHHSQLLQELLAQGKIRVQDAEAGSMTKTITFHDPCYLGRQNGVVSAPRQALAAANLSLVEMEPNRSKSFCCGAGGGQMWKEEEHGRERVNASRFRQAAATGAKILATGCPFCMVMLNDARKDANSEMQVQDIAEILAGQLPNKV